MTVYYQITIDLPNGRSVKGTTQTVEDEAAFTHATEEFMHEWYSPDTFASSIQTDWGWVALSRHLIKRSVLNFERIPNPALAQPPRLTEEELSRLRTRYD